MKRFEITPRCVLCGSCVDLCPVGAISFGKEQCVIDEEKCVRCGVCERHCGFDAITMTETITEEEAMEEALYLAEEAGKNGDIPIGAVVLYEGRIIGRGKNEKEISQDATHHAEILALQEAAKTLGHWWLEDCTLLVTLEPCAMCAGAIVNTRVSRLVYAAKNPRFGACESALRLLEGPTSNHRVEVVSGLCEEKASSLLSRFFRELREKKRLDREGGTG